MLGYELSSQDVKSIPASPISIGRCPLCVVQYEVVKRIRPDVTAGT